MSYLPVSEQARGLTCLSSAKNHVSRSRENHIDAASQPKEAFLSRGFLELSPVKTDNSRYGVEHESGIDEASQPKQAFLSRGFLELSPVKTDNSRYDVEHESGIDEARESKEDFLSRGFLDFSPAKPTGIPSSLKRKKSGISVKINPIRYFCKFGHVTKHDTVFISDPSAVLLLATPGLNSLVGVCDAARGDCSMEVFTRTRFKGAVKEKALVDGNKYTKQAKQRLEIEEHLDSFPAEATSLIDMTDFGMDSRQLSDRLKIGLSLWLNNLLIKARDHTSGQKSSYVGSMFSTAYRQLAFFRSCDWKPRLIPVNFKRDVTQSDALAKNIFAVLKHAAIPDDHPMRSALQSSRTYQSKLRGIKQGNSLLSCKALAHKYEKKAEFFEPDSLQYNYWESLNFLHELCDIRRSEVPLDRSVYNYILGNIVGFLLTSDPIRMCSLTYINRNLRVLSQDDHHSTGIVAIHGTYFTYRIVDPKRLTSHFKCFPIILLWVFRHFLEHAAPLGLPDTSPLFVLQKGTEPKNWSNFLEGVFVEFNNGRQFYLHKVARVGSDMRVKNLRVSAGYNAMVHSGQTADLFYLRSSVIDAEAELQKFILGTLTKSKQLCSGVNAMFMELYYPSLDLLNKRMNPSTGSF